VAFVSRCSRRARAQALARPSWCREWNSHKVCRVLVSEGGRFQHALCFVERPRCGGTSLVSCIAAETVSDCGRDLSKNPDRRGGSAALGVIGYRPRALATTTGLPRQTGLSEAILKSGRRRAASSITPTGRGAEVPGRSLLRKKLGCALRGQGDRTALIVPRTRRSATLPSGRALLPGVPGGSRGALRSLGPIIGTIVRKFLACGDSKHGFARGLVPALSRRIPSSVFLPGFAGFFAPVCHEKRALEKAGWVPEHVCAEVPHRHFVFTIPNRLRINFRFERRLLGELRRTTSGQPDAAPGRIGAIQTFG